MNNSVKTAMLMASLTAVLVLAGQAMAGRGGAILFFIFALIMNFVSYWFSDKIVLKIYRGREVSKQELPLVYEIVEQLTKEANMPMPKIYVTPQPEPNAFATGRNPEHAAVAVTEGILQLLNRDELEGVLAHELAHVRNRDILISTVAAAMAGAITMLASIARWGLIFGGFGSRDDRDNGGGALGAIVMMIVAPLAAALIQMAISRAREYDADKTGAKICKNPMGLAGALEKLDAYSKRRPMLDASPSTAHMFIVNPLSGKNLMSLFSTHPPIEDRVKRLRELKTI